MEPTLQQLRGALNNCCLSYAFGDQAYALEKLKALRAAKNSWIGQEENEFRFELDHYLKDRS